MNSTPLRLKQSHGWFAAGREVAQALALLSDGAFKVYVYVCLSANRHTARLQISVPILERALQRDHQMLAQQLAELKDRAVCDVVLDAAGGGTCSIGCKRTPVGG